MSKNTPWALQNFNRVDFNPKEFDRTIYQKGARMLWEKSILCSCLVGTNGVADFNCSSCNGRGYSYFGSEAIRGVVNGITGDKGQIPIGLLDVGTSYLTTMSEDMVAFRDRITFTDFTTAYSETAKYSPGGAKLRYPVINLVSLRVLDQEIPHDLITLAEDKQTIYVDESYGFQKGEGFSILYHIHPRYIVIDIPHELRGTYVKFGNSVEEWEVLPRQFLIKREDLMSIQRGELT